MNDGPDSVRFSVVIPVHDRRERLEACLASLSRDGFDGTAEVLVLCDGGPASMREAQRAWTGPWPLRWIDLSRAGPAAVRNHAARIARGEVFLFLNDDVVCEPGLLAAHDAAHRRRPGHAVMGNTRWHPDVVITDFMHWCAHHYHVHYLIDDPDNITWEYLHTLNASIDRCWFDQGHLYDESFPDPAFEDTEHAYRLAQAGMRIAFAPGALVHHHHYFEPAHYVAKSVMRGRSARRFLERWPELTARILDEYRVAISRAGRGLLGRTLLGLPDGPAQWYARIGLAFLAGYEGRPLPWLAKACRGTPERLTPGAAASAPAGTGPGPTAPAGR